jgi:glycerol-3-phosphate acyltransferase PlsY
MENRLGLFKIAFWLTMFLAALKLSNTVDMSTFMVFLPLIVAFGIFFIVVFLIGLLVLYYYINHQEEIDDLIEKNKNKGSDE